MPSPLIAMHPPPSQPDKEEKLRRLAASVRDGDGRALETIYQKAVGGEILAVETLFRLLIEEIPGAMDSFVRLALKDKSFTAQEHLFAHLRNVLRDRAAAILGKQTADPSDLAQSCLRRFLEQLPDLDHLNGPQLLAYLQRMAQNWATDSYRKQKRHREVELKNEDSTVETPAPGRTAGGAPDLGLEEWIVNLSVEEKAIVRMKYKEGLNYDEIGLRLDPPRSYDAVRMKLTRILRHLGGD